MHRYENVQDLKKQENDYLHEISSMLLGRYRTDMKTLYCDTPFIMSLSLWRILADEVILFQCVGLTKLYWTTKLPARQAHVLQSALQTK